MTSWMCMVKQFEVGYKLVIRCARARIEFTILLRTGKIQAAANHKAKRLESPATRRTAELVKPHTRWRFARSVSAAGSGRRACWLTIAGWSPTTPLADTVMEQD